MTSNRPVAYFVALAISLCLPGCNSSPVFQDLVPVTGSVTFDGEPLVQGVVAFAPSDPSGQTAVGIIADGKFTMNTSASAAGVVAGTYKVRIESNEPRDPDAPPPTGAPDADAAKPASLIPERYNSIETSEIEVDISPGMAPLQFDLTSE